MTLRRAPFLLLLLALPLFGAEPGAPPFVPYLRPSGAAHSGEIQALAIDPAGATLVTASLDRTARLWDLRSGALLQVLRPPIDGGPNGELYSAAFSPDGARIAIAGTTGLFPGGGASVYLFDRGGRMERQFGGAGFGPDSFLALRFSPDGSRLIGATRNHGVVLFDSKSGDRLRQSGGCGQFIPDLDVDRAGRIAAISRSDGVCLFDAALDLIREYRRPITRAPVFLMFPPGGRYPRTVRFSPDGSRLAVGYGDGSRIDVRSGTDLSLLYRPDTLAFGSSLGALAFSAAGDLLYAGGTASATEPAPLLRIDGAGLGPVVELSGPGAAITALAGRPFGGLLVGSADGGWSAVDGPSPPRPPQPLRPGGPLDFLVDGTGERVQFVVDGKRLGFSLREERLMIDPPADGALRGPETTSAGWQVKPGEAADTMLVNGSALHPSGRLEKSRFTSFAIGPADRLLVVGTDMGILVYQPSRVIDRSNFQLETPAPVAAVNVSGDGKLIVAALFDGTLRFYRSIDGAPLLVLRATPQGARWVAYTPSGYYDASVGGEDLMGWHKNRDADQAADFFPAARFRQRFFRPVVVTRMIELRDEERALAEAGDSAPAAPLRPPPVVTILSPVDGALLREGRVRVRVVARSPSGDAITSVRALVDGRAAQVERGRVDLGAGPPPPLSPGEQSFDLVVPVPPRDLSLAILAESAAGVSEPAALRLRWAGAAAKEEGRPRLLLLAIGVSRYRRPELRLGFAAKDARDLAQALSGRPGVGLFSAVESRVLLDEQASLLRIREGLRWLAERARPQDLAVLFLSGHGVGDSRGRYAFLPQDGDGAQPSTLLDGEELRRTLATVPGRAMLFLDSCHAGSVLPAVPVRFVNELSAHESGVVVFVAATAAQASKESERWQNGAFTRALLEGLAGQADTRHTGRVTVSMLDLYVSERVREATAGTQTPAVAKPTLVPDFPLAILR